MNSHIPTLRLICSLLTFPYDKLSKTFEFGCGIFSTPLFLHFAVKHYAVETIGHPEEQRSREWFDKISNQYLSDAGLEMSIGTLEDNFAELARVKPDLVFVDAAAFRPKMVNEAFKHTSVVIAHDTEEAGYGWEEVQEPEGWHRCTRASKEIPDPLGAWTTVWTNIPSLFVHLYENFSRCPIPRKSFTPVTVIKEESNV